MFVHKKYCANVILFIIHGVDVVVRCHDYSFSRRGGLMRIILCIFLLIGITASNVSASDCVPPCRSGYFCHEGQCAPNCNPPCEGGAACDSVTHECVQTGQTGTQKSAECAETQIRFVGDCKDKRWVVSAGNMGFVPLEILYGLGTVANLTWSSILLGLALNKNASDDFSAIPLSTSLGLVLFGALVQIPKHQQKAHLEELGASTKGNLLAAGWILYGASVVTSVGSGIIAFGKPDAATAVAMAINIPVLIASFAVNTAGYVKQRKMLRNAVYPESKHAFEIRPYSTIVRGGGGIGVMASF
jgi:hypothetical protein